MDDPVISRRPMPVPPPSSTSLPTSSQPVPLTSSGHSDAMEGVENTEAAVLEHNGATPTQANGDGGARNPLNSLLTTAASSSPSRALSRMWDRFSPPSLSSPFSLPHPPPFPHPGQLLARSSAPLSASSGATAPLPGLADGFRRGRGLSSGAVTPAEERELASQLSFSLRRGAAGRAHREGGGAASSQERSRRIGRSSSAPDKSGTMDGEGWEPHAFRLLPDVRMPAVLAGRVRRGKEREREREDSGLHEDDMMVDDEACFVDGWEGKVDFLTSLPSELALSILLHLDFRTILACSAVSQHWRLLALDPLLWRELFHQNPRWSLKPEVYRAAEAAAAAAAQAASVAGTPMPSSPAPRSDGGGYFDAHLPHLPRINMPRPDGMPSLKRAASSFSRAAANSGAGAKRAVVAGADRVQSSSAALGRKISEIAGDFHGLNLVPSASSGVSGGSIADSSIISSASPSVIARSTPPRPTAASLSVATALPPSSPSLSTSLISPSTPSTALASLPSTSTLPTHAFASPPSASGGLSRTNSSTALSSLSSLPSMATARRPSRPPPSTPRVTDLADDPRPDGAASPAARGSAAGASLDWPRLFRDKWRLERRWETGQSSWSWMEGHGDSVYCVQFDEKKVISGSRDRTIRIWDLASGTSLRTLTGHEGSVLCLQYDSSILVSGSSDSRILVWDLEPGSATQFEVKMTLVGHAMGVLDLCFDKEWIVSCSKDTTTRVWHRSTGQLYRTLSGHRGPVNAVQLHGSHVLSASGDALMKLWDLHTGQALRTFSGHSRGLACVHWAPSGRFFVSGSNDKTIKLWDAETGECVQTFVGHGDLVRSLWYDEKAQRVVSASYDRTTRVWDATSGAQVQKFKSHASLVFDVAFDASKIVSCSHDQRILVMDFGVGLDVDKFA